MKKVLLSRFLLCALALTGYVSHVANADQTIALVPANNPVSVPFSQSKTFDFDMVPQAGHTVLLKIRTRMDTPTLGGSMHFLRIKLNGKEVLPARGRSLMRLLNKPLVSPVTPTDKRSWFMDSADPSGWNVIYAPDFKLGYTQSYYEGDPYLYVLDVTDLSNPIAGNRLEITNTATADFVQRTATHAGRKDPKLDMVIGSLEMEVTPGESPMMAASEGTLPPVINHGEPAAGPAKYKGTLFDGGGFALTIGKNVFNFASAFSYPDAGFNRLKSTFDNSGQKDWKVTQKGNKIIAVSPDYTIERIVTFGAQRAEISDKVTNRHKDAPFGLSVRNEMDTTRLKDKEIRLAGNPDPMVSLYHSYGNPSVYVRTSNMGIGMITADDVYRNQSLLYVHNDDKTKRQEVGIRTDMLYLPPGGSYTLKWAVYPVAGPDYYDFINLARQDWGANYTVPGFWLWGLLRIAKLTPDEMRAIVKREDIYAITATDWVDWVPRKDGTQRYDFGSSVFSDHWAGLRQEIRDAAQKVRQAAPDVKVVAYYNSLRESADDTPKRFADSLMINPDGNPRSRIWTSLGATNTTYRMVPTLENSFGKEMVDVAQRYMDDMGLDGLYIDEFEGAAQYNDIPITYKDNFDGHSCVLDPKTWRIKQQVGIVSLSNTAFKKEIIDLVLQRKGPLLINGASAVKGTAGPHINRMIETQHNDYWGFEGLLQSPLGYLSWNHSWKDYLHNFKLGLIPGMGLSLELPPIAEHLFPFTPIELHSGYLLGKERIIATHSGNYGWANERQLSRVYFFNSEGKISDADFVTKIGKEARTEVTLKPQEAVILERVPVFFVPAKDTKNWNAEASQVSYDEDKISLHLNASDGGDLLLQNGMFPLENGRSLSVQIGANASRKLKVTKNTLRVPVPAGFKGAIDIYK